MHILLTANQNPCFFAAELNFEALCWILLAVVSSGDWLVGVIGLPFALTSLIDLQTALQQRSGPLRLLLNFLYILAVAVGFGPTFYFPYHNKPFYIAWRAWFVANSVFWSLLRYAFTLYRYTVMASEAQITHTAFVLKALLFGPHVITLMLGIGYPLSIDIAFPFAAIFSIGTSACCGFIHSMVVQSPATQPHLEFLDRLLCSGFYGDFVLVTTGTPCSPESVLLNLWCAESGVSLFLITYFIMLEQSNRRKAFFQVSGLVEPYPVFFDGFFSHSTSIGAFVVLGLCLMYLLSSWDSHGLVVD